MSEITYEVVKSLSVLSSTGKGWTKEVNIVCWNEGPTKLDIREWDHKNEKMKKGITFNRNEVAMLKSVLEKVNLDRISEKYSKDLSRTENDTEYPSLTEEEYEEI